MLPSHGTHCHVRTFYKRELAFLAGVRSYDMPLEMLMESVIDEKSMGRAQPVKRSGCHQFVCGLGRINS